MAWSPAVLRLQKLAWRTFRADRNHKFRVRGKTANVRLFAAGFPILPLPMLGQGFRSVQRAGAALPAAVFNFMATSKMRFAISFFGAEARAISSPAERIVTSLHSESKPMSALET